jgi:hypothetical protein
MVVNMRAAFSILLAGLWLCASGGMLWAEEADKDVYVDYRAVLREVAHKAEAAGVVALADELKGESETGGKRQLALRFAVYLRAGYERDLEGLFPLIKRKAAGDWDALWWEMARDLLGHGQWRLSRIYFELLPKLGGNGVRELLQHWEKSGSGLSAEGWVRQRMAEAPWRKYDLQTDTGRTGWVKVLFQFARDHKRSETLMAEYGERLEKNPHDFQAVADLRQAVC